MMRDIKNDSHIDGSLQSAISLQVTPFTTRPTFKAFVGLVRGQNAPKWAQNGLISPVGAPQMVQDEVWKNAFLTHF